MYFCNPSIYLAIPARACTNLCSWKEPLIVKAKQTSRVLHLAAEIQIGDQLETHLAARAMVYEETPFWSRRTLPSKYLRPDAYSERTYSEHAGGIAESKRPPKDLQDTGTTSEPRIPAKSRVALPSYLARYVRISMEYYSQKKIAGNHLAAQMRPRGKKPSFRDPNFRVRNFSIEKQHLPLPAPSPAPKRTRPSGPTPKRSGPKAKRSKQEPCEGTAASRWWAGGEGRGARGGQDGVTWGGRVRIRDGMGWNGGWWGMGGFRQVARHKCFSAQKNSGNRRFHLVLRK